MYLKKILIQNFKGIENISLEFKKGINLLIGDNGAGKTSVLSAVVVALGDFFQGISGVKSKTLKQKMKHKLPKFLLKLVEKLLLLLKQVVQTLIVMQN